jgi:hypothetical protein
MNVTSILALGLIMFVFSSCETQRSGYPDPYKNPLIVLVLPIFQKDLLKFEEDKKAYVKEVELWSKRERNWKYKENDFMKSLSNKELEAYGEFKETYKKGGAKHLLAYRKFDDMIHESPDIKKRTTFKWLCREEGELIKQAETLDSKTQELEKRRKYWADMAAWFEKEHRKSEEDRQHREIVSAIRGIDSTLEQWRMQQWSQQWLWTK